MATAKEIPSAYEVLWDKFLVEARAFFDGVQDWIQGLSEQEQLLGLCLFVFALMVLILIGSRKKKDPGSNGRQFGGALLVVVIFAFGASWTVDSGGGGLSHLFGR